MTDGVRLRLPGAAEKPKKAAPKKDDDEKPPFNDQIPSGPEDDE